MLTYTTALLPLLAGCHVFADGEIPLTCDDLADCDPVFGADSGVPQDAFTLSAGLALSMTDVEQWLAIAYDPPALDLQLQKGGYGSTAGAVSWSSDRNRLFLAADGALLAFGADKSDIKKFELPTAEGVRDMVTLNQSVFLISNSWLIKQPSPNAEAIVLNDSDGGLGFVSMVADGLSLYIVAVKDDGGPSLYRYDTETDDIEMLAEAFDVSTEKIDGDLFLDDAGALMSCSAAGEIYILDEVIADGIETPIVSPSVLTVSDVLTCGIDPETGRFLVISASQGLIVLSPDEDDVRIELTAEGHTLGGAQIY